MPREAASGKPVNGKVRMGLTMPAALATKVRIAAATTGLDVTAFMVKALVDAVKGSKK